MADEHKIQVNYKFGAYDEHMLNVRGDSVAEVESLISVLTVQTLTDFGALLKGAQAAVAVTQPAAAAPTSPAPSSTSGAEGRYCQHGPRTRRTGKSARGDWVGWFCKLPKNHPDQCKAEFED